MIQRYLLAMEQRINGQRKTSLGEAECEYHVSICFIVEAYLCREGSRMKDVSGGITDLRPVEKYLQ